MPTIKVRVSGKIAENLTPEVKIVCGNEDYQVEFEFDEPWGSANVKTGLFIYNGKLVAQPFDGAVCPMPIIENTTLLAIGVKTSDGELYTTTPAYADCLKSASDLVTNKIPAPSKDVYDEIIALINKYIEQGGGIDEEAVKQLIKEETADLVAENDRDEFVKGGLTESTETWTDDDKAKACETIGALKKPANPARGSVVTMQGDGTVGTTQMVQESATPWSIPLRDGNGCIKGATPKVATDLTPKAYVDEKNDALSQDISVINLTLEQIGLLKKYKQPITQEYNERVTADGLNVLDGSKAVLKKVVGNTVAYGKDENGLNGKLKNASFGGIESTNADGTETSTLSFPKTETPLGVTIDFENKKITDYGVDLVLTGEEDWGYYDYNKFQSVSMLNLSIPTGNKAVADYVSTDSERTGSGYGSGNMWCGYAGGHVFFWIGILAKLGYIEEGTTPTTEEQATAIANFKAWLAQRYADGNPVTIRYVSATLQNETDLTTNNEYTAYKGGTEKVLGNDSAEFGAENTLTQDYIFVTEVK